MNVSFSQRLAQLRKEKGISQKRAAAELGISQALLSHYEKGIRECGLPFLCRSAAFYGVTTDYLLGISEQRHNATAQRDAGSDLPEDHTLSPATIRRAQAVVCAGLPDTAPFACDALSLAQAILLYKVLLRQQENGNLPDCWILDAMPHKQPMFHAILDTLTNMLLKQSAAVPPETERMPLCVQTVLQEVQQYIQDQLPQHLAILDK